MFGEPIRREMSREEIEWALKQLTAIGYLENREDTFSISDSGVAAAIAIENGFDSQTKILLMFFYGYVLDQEDEVAWK